MIKANPTFSEIDAGSRKEGNHRVLQKLHDCSDIMAHEALLDQNDAHRNIATSSPMSVHVPSLKNSLNIVEFVRVTEI